MKNKFLIIIALLGLLIVSGAECGTKKQDRSEGTFIGGIGALELNFLPDSPPDANNFQNEPIPIAIILKNKGEYSVAKNSVNLKIVGAFTDRNFKLTKSTATNIHDILAVSQGLEALEYDEANVDMGYATYTAEMFAPEVKQDLTVEACYSYQTKFHINELCIPSTGRTIEEGECSVDSGKNLVTAGSNSAAPVQIATLREEAQKNSVRIIMDIVEQDSGNVIDCVNLPTAKDKNKIKVNVKSSDIKCAFSEGEGNIGTITLKGDNSYRLICEKPITNPGRAFAIDFEAILDYSYKQDISKQVTIRQA